MSVASELVTLAQTKEDIGAAIIQKGGAYVFPNAAYDAEVEYLESTGAQYIDTGISMSSNSATGLKVVVDSYGVCGHGIIHNNVAGGTWLGTAGLADLSSMRIYKDTYSSRITRAYPAARNLHVWDGSTGFSENGELVESFTSGVGSDDITGIHWLLGRNYDFYISGPVVAVPPAFKLYSAKMWVNGNIVRDFRPVRKDGVGYLYDKVSGQLFGNAGTGAFLYGEDLRPLPLEFSKYGDLVRSLPCSIDSLPLDDEEASWCIFVDCDGKAVAVYNRTQTQALTALPSVPDPPFEGLVNGIWNWTLDEIKSSALPMCIGPMYDTNDGKTWIDIEIPSDGYEWHFNSQDNQTFARIDWGDGSSPETKTTGLHAHTYAQKGSYRVKVYKESGSGNVRALSGAICGSYRSSTAPNCMNDMALIRRIADMSPVRGALGPLYGAIGLEYFVEGSGCTSTSVGLGEGCHLLKQFTVPPSCIQGFTVGGSFSTTARNWALKCVCFPPNMTRTSSNTGGWHVIHECGAFVCRHSVGPSTDATKLGNSWLDGAYNVVSVRFPGNIPLHTGTSGSTNCFRNCRSLKHIVVPTGYTATNTIIGSAEFQNCYSLEELDWLDLTGITTLEASAFYGCYKLWYGKTVSFPALTSIKQNSLNGTGAKKFIVGAQGTTLTTESTGAFAYNYLLEEIEFLGNVSTVQGSFFGNCFALKKISFKNATAVPTLSNTNAFTNTPSLQQIIVPDALHDTWKVASNWSSTTNNIVNCIVKASEA